jgi:hypothetical protein
MKKPVSCIMKKKTKPCFVSCSVLKDEIEKLVNKGELNADLLFASKYFHVDYAQIEKHLRPVIEGALKRNPENVILVYVTYASAWITR